MRLKHYNPAPLEFRFYRPQLVIFFISNFWLNGIKKLMAAEVHDHVIGRFAFGPLLIRIPCYVCALILAMASQLHTLVPYSFSNDDNIKHLILTY